MAIIHVQQNQKKLLDEIQATLHKAKRIVAITGAGISTNCGIPDFRSKEGLYDLIDSELKSRAGSSNPSASSLKGKDLFSSAVWQDEDSTSVFYSFIASLRQKIKQDVKSTSQTHRLLRRIRDQKKLLRCYTQNIDGLEARDGLSLDTNRGKGSRGRFTKKNLDLPGHEQHNVSLGKMDGGCEVVQLHGDLETTRCTVCQKVEPWTSADGDCFIRGEAPSCASCELNDAIRQASGKRGSAVGNLHPNIVLYGESNPMEADIGSLLTHDLTFGPDLLLIMGTSLKVHGLKTIVKEFAKAVHSKKTGKVIFVNLTEPAKSTWKDVIDYWVEMDCDEWSRDKFRLQQKELAFTSTTKAKEAIASIDKENIPSTAQLERITKFPIQNAAPKKISTKKRALAELDAEAINSHSPTKRARLLETTQSTRALPTPPSSQKVKKSQRFEIWDAEDASGRDRSSVNVNGRGNALDVSPSKKRKRQLQ